LRRVPNLEILTLILANISIFLYQSSLGLERLLFSYEYGAIPQRISAALYWIRVEGPAWENLEPLGTLFTAMFLHGDGAHLVNNLLFLWIFGSLLEGILGKWLFPLLYLITGACGNLAQAYLVPMSASPVIGASGAIAGMEGAYLVLALRWVLPWPHVWPMARPIPPMHLGLVALIGFLFDISSVGDRSAGIAYAAHIGGFVAGVTLALLLTLLKPQARREVREARRV
jgi:membrane associated rhomboid family serine protease